MSEKVIALLVIAIGVAVSAYLWQQSAKAQQAAGWPSVAGKIVSSEVDWRHARGGDSSDRREYRAIVRYEYRVADGVHRAERLRFPNPGYGSSDEQAREIVQRYPAGKTVPVFYNPQNPEEACLEPGKHWSAWLAQAVGALVVLVGLFLLRR
ncbi:MULTISPECIES: DUF3592 domain-containing protein [Chromobacterium]|uniref:DUF3592 domain-containing protein n=1 Tax=Chromobacterium TaxID=535 RepID=UPI000D2F66DE|nr:MULTISPECIES: DUF3592 domain-containing protein [Chromobacterium]MCP1291917.1 DUF3592 domain-containing protein [Chromobacterium sp. S0633]PTU63790.1 DUF3592 domain-containing protein [Chromobacterium sp. Panama]UJB32165.1 DUF3592 domain-containing protein [Chromobacterium sp. Beijing]